MRQVYFENWQAQLEAMLDLVDDLANRIGDPERQALLVDLEQLNEMAQQIREVQPENRVHVKSAVMAWSVKETVDLPEDLVATLGELFEIYRRFRTKLTWKAAE